MTRLKRFHTFGIGESRADEMLGGIEAFKQEGGIKLGFQAHYPQLETKLAVRGDDEADLAARLAPVEAEVRKRLGNFIIAEDEQTLEGVILGKLLRGAATRWRSAEMFTGGNIAARLAPLAGAETVFQRGVVTRDAGELGIAGGRRGSRAVGQDLREESGASHALAVLMQLDEGADRPDFGGTICIGIADARGHVSRQARLIGGRDWVRVGAVELGLDCLRRHLLGLPVDERIDFERRETPPSA